jgi:hypothetical protein
MEICGRCQGRKFKNFRVRNTNIVYRKCCLCLSVIKVIIDMPVTPLRPIEAMKIGMPCEMVYSKAEIPNTEPFRGRPKKVVVKKLSPDEIRKFIPVDG